MNWRVAKSLLKLREQINAAVPNRSREWDGDIGDAKHAARTSDHNPWLTGADGVPVVTAIDVTHDPKHGFDSYAFAELLRQKQDKRIKYVISNRRIFSSVVSPWIWRDYHGESPHDHHVHISVMADKAIFDLTNPWNIDGLGVQGPIVKRATQPNILATVFGGLNDDQFSAYDDHRIGDKELSVALPFHFGKPLPLVRVINRTTGKEAVCQIADVGPWNTNDPYWVKPNGRPQAETGVDMRGRKTNRAGIDLSPAAAKALGISGMGRVDWEFIQEPKGEIA